MTLAYRRPRVMGILNATDDSFFATSRARSPERIEQRVTAMLAAGVDIVDVGGESTRPGSEYVDAATERERVIPAVRSIRALDPTVAISIDTRKAPVAEAALDAGATIVNDVSALRDDPRMGALVAERGVAVCLMHMRGTPRDMQRDPRYRDVVGEVRAELAERKDAALAAGIAEERIVLDPGIGFGKRFEDNWALLANLDALRDLGSPLLIGLSRKSFLGAIGRRGRDAPEHRLVATIAAQLWCTLLGVEIIRVHDVVEFREALAAFDAIAAHT